MKEELIEWDVIQPTLRARLMVRTIHEDLPATIDDLKRACEAVGLHVVGEDASWKDQSIKDWAELAKHQTSWLTDVRKALDPKGISHADLATMASATVAARDLAMTAAAKAEGLAASRLDHVEALTAEVVTLRAQLAAASQSTTSPEGRATDEELMHAYATGATTFHTDGLRAVAARVRRERGECLVERLVAAKRNASVWWCDAGWCASVDGKLAQELPAADVPATLARLAGLEVK